MADKNLPEHSGSQEKHSDSSKPEAFPAYALYRYHINRPTELNADQDEEVEQDSLSGDAKHKDLTGNGSFSLSSVVTSLNAEHEECLRKFIAKKMFRGTVYSRSGHIANVDLSTEPDEDHTGLCYYCLLRQQPSNSSTIGINNSSIPCSTEYIVCFLTSANVLLDLFRSELDRYSSGLLSLVDSDPILRYELEDAMQPLDIDMTVKPYLQQWYDTITKYLCRCVNVLGEDIKYLIHAALTNARVEVRCSQQELKVDINKFIHCCSLAELLDSSKSAEKTGSSSSLSDTGALLVDLCDPLGVDAQCVDIQTPVITLNINNDNTYQFQNQECTQFCDDWAQALTSGDPSNPVFIRQIIDSFKLKAIHDMNTLKRLLRLSEADLYALYRCYAFLCSCGNGSILMQHANMENVSSGSVAATKVLKVLGEHIQESGGFQLPKKKIPVSVS